MNIKAVHSAAHLSGSIYKIVYMAITLATLLRRRDVMRAPKPPRQRYH